MGMTGAIVAMNPTESFAIGFSGSYAPSNWTFGTSNGGSVNTTNAPTSITLNNTVLDGSTSYTVTAAGSGTVTFNWSYTNPRDTANYNPLLFILNGNRTSLFDLVANSGSGTDSFSVAAGDRFGFKLESLQSFGPASTTFTNFSAPDATPVPFDFDPSLGLAALGLGFGGKRLLKTFLRNNKSKKD